MANTVIEAIVTTFVTHASSPDAGIQYPVDFTPNPPYTYVTEITGSRVKPLLCSDKGGTAVFQFGAVTQNSAIDAVSLSEEMIDFVKEYLVGDFSPIKIYNVVVDNVRDVNDGNAQTDSLIYHRIFEATFEWEYIT